MQSFFVLFGVLSTALLGSFYPLILPWLAFGALLVMVYLWWQQRGKGFQPQSEIYKELEKIKKKRHKEDNKKHKENYNCRRSKWT